jgi:hypothetical protein
MYAGPLIWSINRKKIVYNARVWQKREKVLTPLIAEDDYRKQTEQYSSSGAFILPNRTM